MSIGSTRPLIGLAVLAIGVAGATEAHAFAPAVCAPDNVANGACFGLEPTFTNDNILGQARGGAAAQTALDAWRAAVPDACAALPHGTHCRLEALTNGEAWDDKCRVANRNAASAAIGAGQKFRVCVYPADEALKPWYYQVEWDYGCLELNTRPSNLAWLTTMAAGGGVMDRLIFGVAHTAGLRVDAVVGAGHVHIDVESGFASALKLLNFMTAIHNLRLFPLMPNVGATALNAPPLSWLGADARARYWRFVQDHNGYNGNLVTLTTRLKEAVYLDTYNDRRLQATDHDRAILTARFRAFLGDQFVYQADWPVPVDPAHVSQPLRDHLNQIPAGGERRRWTHYRSGDNDDSIGLGWAQKGQHIRMGDAYGTIEIRNIAPQQSAQHIVDIVTLLQAAMTRAPTNQVLLLQDDLALDHTDGDGVLAWLWAERGLGLKRFVQGDAAITQNEAADIFDRFRVWCNDDARMCRLTRYMPGRVRTTAEAYCHQHGHQE